MTTEPSRDEEREDIVSAAVFAAAMRYHCENRRTSMPRDSKTEIEAFIAGARFQAERDRAEIARLSEALEAVISAVQEHAEGGNIENYGFLSDKLEALAELGRVKGGAQL